GVGAEELDEKLLPTLAREIAAFLHALPSTPTPLARAAGMHEFQMDDGRHPWLENGVNFVMKLRGIDPVLDRALDWLKLEAWTHHFDAPWHPVHGGLEARHVLVDSIDWSHPGRHRLDRLASRRRGRRLQVPRHVEGLGV